MEEFCLNCTYCVKHCKCAADDFAPASEDMEGWTCDVCEYKKKVKNETK